MLTILQGQKPFPADYSQTVIRYDYQCQNGDFLASEKMGVIENEKNIWIHPPRTFLFKILEINPFPYIKAPYSIGTKWNWNLKIGEFWGDERWIKWKGTIQNNYKYEITGIKEIKFGLKNLSCFEIKAKAESEIGETELIAYFNEEVGFVKLEYTNIDNTKLILELEKVE